MGEFDTSFRDLQETGQGESGHASSLAPRGDHDVGLGGRGPAGARPAGESAGLGVGGFDSWPKLVHLLSRIP
jgi:hypothetical protein